jgi:hypothetical protein
MIGDVSLLQDESETMKVQHIATFFERAARRQSGGHRHLRGLA